MFKRETEKEKKKKKKKKEMESQCIQFLITGSVLYYVCS